MEGVKEIVENHVFICRMGGLNVWDTHYESVAFIMATVEELNKWIMVILSSNEKRTNGEGRIGLTFWQE